jgi:DNA-binding NarL/FixJ family response regulator
MNTAPPTSFLGTILIVDDTPGNLAVLSDMLSEAGYRVLVATDGLSAIEQLDYLKPDIILLDVMMPGIDGFETCRRLKKNQETMNIPIIFMTGLNELDNLLKGFEEGAIDYIVKPIRPAEVLVRVEAQLAQSRNLQRVENTLHQLMFAAIAFNSSGLITWLTTSAIAILADSHSPSNESSCKIHSGDYLPKPLYKQIIPLLDRMTDPDESVNDIQIGQNYSGKIIHCHQIDEFMLLIQKRRQEWDLASLKSSFGLTAREAEILMWISRGKTNKEVGLILETSPRTVNKHLEHIFEKLGVPTRTAAVAKVMTPHLHTPS